MKTKRILKHFALCYLLSAFCLSSHAQGTAFTYQGRLNDGATRATGSYDLTFAVFTDSNGVNQVGSTLTNTATVITNGLFTSVLDFGPGIFTGPPLWLQIGVETNGGGGSFTALAPLQQLTPAPYAIYSSGAGSAVSANGVAAGSVTGAGIAGSSVVKSLNNLQDAVTLAPGANVTITPSGNTLTIASSGGGGGGSNNWSLTGNSGTTAGVDFLGTTDNQPLELHINGTLAFRLVPGYYGNPNVVGGWQNSVGPYADAVTIAGGYGNSASGTAATVGGGYANTANGNYATLGGGIGNYANGTYATMCGGQNNSVAGQHAAVGGGSDNQAGNEYSTVAGGYQNINYGIGAFIGGGGYDGTTFAGNMANGNATTVGGGLGNIAGNTYATVGGGYGNQATGLGSFVGGGGYDGTSYIGNTASGAAATVAGGLGNQATALWATVGGGHGNICGFVEATIGGGYGNIINNPGQAATIGGGAGNLISGFGATIGGGFENTNSGAYATVSGGAYNRASGPGSFLGGGGYDGTSYSGNTASGQASTVAGGLGNLAGSYYATVGGGESNNCSGEYATIPGGYNNQAKGTGSFAAGQSATANDNNSFIWGDGSRAGVSQGVNSFSVLATGGAWFFSGAYPAGVKLLANGTQWISISDRNAKKNIVPVDCQAVLEKLAAIPIQQWNYKWEKDSDVPNIGPMAQDFKHAFYPGRDDKGIGTLEFDGVELAAIQGLNQKLNEKDAEIQDLKQSVADLKKLVQSLAEKK